MKFTLFTAFLFSIGWTSVVVAGEGRPPSCCLTVTDIKKIPVEKIVSYDIHGAPCPIRAIRFYTKKNKVICADPESEWAKEIKEILDGRTSTPTSTTKCVPSTTNLISTTVTTEKTQRTETETSTRTIPPPLVFIIKTSGPKTSTSTSVPPTVTTIKTSGQETSTITSSATNDCCLTLTKHKPAFHEIVDYRIQETPPCSVRAVLFITVENITLCFSAIEDWIQDYIQNLNRRRTTDKREFAIKGIKDPYKNTNNYLCLKKEQAKYFCVKQL